MDQIWNHDRNHIRLLHHAHADHIESLYRAMLARPGNPDEVVIEEVGPVRTFLARGKRWENRAIFHGDETTEQIDRVLEHFDRHRASCVIEVNIANSYVDPPNNWEARLLPHLLARGCKAGGMRCVWFRNRAASTDDLGETHRIERFTPEQIDVYATLMTDAGLGDRWTHGRCAVESRSGLFHYVGFDQNQPCAFGSLFVKGKIAYLAYWETQRERRGRGFQQAGILKRVVDAFDLGCDLAFTVSDYNFASSRNLQRCGFELAYNYLVVTRDSVPVS